MLDDRIERMLLGNRGKIVIHLRNLLVSFEEQRILGILEFIYCATTKDVDGSSDSWKGKSVWYRR